MSTKTLFFEPISPDAAVTMLETWLDFITYTKEGECPCSMTPGQAKTLMESPILKQYLPRVDRIFDYSIPIKLFKPEPEIPAVVESPKDGDSLSGKMPFIPTNIPNPVPGGSHDPAPSVQPQAEPEQNAQDISHQVHESYTDHNTVCLQKEGVEPGGAIKNITTADLQQLDKAVLFKLEPGFGHYQQANGERIYYYCHRYTDHHISFKEAETVIKELFREFPLDKQSKTNAIARLITPYCQALMGWRKRTPLVVMTANRPRSGKDYLAMLAPIVHSHFATQDPPLEDESEVKRRITAALISGRRFMHFANCRRDIDNPSLEAAVTTEYWTDRIIRSSNEETVPNEIMFSLSFNGNLPMTRDIASRMLIIRFNNPNPEANSTKYENDLHTLLSWFEPPEKYKKSNTFICRRNVLAALDALTLHWLENDAPPGSTFTSYPEWARVVGGIVKTAGLGDPCIPDKVASMAGTIDDWEIDLLQLAAMTDPKQSYKSRDLTANFIQTKPASFPAFIDYIAEHSTQSFNSELSQYLNTKLGMPLTVDTKTCIVSRSARTRVPHFSFELEVRSATESEKAPAKPATHQSTPEPGERSYLQTNPGGQEENEEIVAAQPVWQNL